MFVVYNAIGRLLASHLYLMRDRITSYSVFHTRKHLHKAALRFFCSLHDIALPVLLQVPADRTLGPDVVIRSTTIFIILPLLLLLSPRMAWSILVCAKPNISWSVRVRITANKLHGVANAPNTRKADSCHRPFYLDITHYLRFPGN